MTMNELAAWLKDQQDVAVIGHVSPDGDAVGTVLAVKRMLEKLGKRVWGVLPDPVPRRYAFLPGADEICLPENVPCRPQCALAVDVSDLGRLGSARTLFEEAPHQGVLDHHGTNAGFGQVWHVEGDRASTGEMVLELAGELGVEVDRDMARCVFVALCTDTGNFNYKNTDCRAFLAAAACVQAGADVEELTRRAFRERSEAAIRLLGEALSHMGGEDGIYYTYVDDEMLRKTGATLEDGSRIVNYMNEISGARVGLYFEQHGEDTKISWRSAGKVNVAAIAGCFGGGGHDAAAGARVRLPMGEAISQVLQKTRECVKGSEDKC